MIEKQVEILVDDDRILTYIWKGFRGASIQSHEFKKKGRKIAEVFIVL